VSQLPPRRDAFGADLDRLRHLSSPTTVCCEVLIEKASDDPRDVGQPDLERRCASGRIPCHRKSPCSRCTPDRGGCRASFRAAQFGKKVTLKFLRREPFWKLVVLGDYVWVQHWATADFAVKEQARIRVRPAAPRAAPRPVSCPSTCVPQPVERLPGIPSTIFDHERAGPTANASGKETGRDCAERSKRRHRDAPSTSGSLRAATESRGGCCAARRPSARRRPRPAIGAFCSRGAGRTPRG